jgi:hypothetical protein
MWLMLILMGVVQQDDVLARRDIEFDPDVGALREIEYEGPIHKRRVVLFAIAMIVPILIANSFSQKGRLFPPMAMASSLLLLLLSLFVCRAVFDVWGFSPVPSHLYSGDICTDDCYGEGLVAMSLVLLLVFICLTLVFSAYAILLISFGCKESYAKERHIYHQQIVHKLLKAKVRKKKKRRGRDSVLGAVVQDAMLLAKSTSQLITSYATDSYTIASDSIRSYKLSSKGRSGRQRNRTNSDMSDESSDDSDHEDGHVTQVSKSSNFFSDKIRSYGAWQARTLPNQESSMFSKSSAISSSKQSNDSRKSSVSSDGSPILGEKRSTQAERVRKGRQKKKKRGSIWPRTFL